jgi:hypothetical protein
VDALREGVSAVRHPCGTSAPRARLAAGGGGCVVMGIRLGFANKTLASRLCRSREAGEGVIRDELAQALRATPKSLSKYH